MEPVDVAALEAAVIGAAHAGRDDEHGLDAWLRTVEAEHPGRTPSIPTAEAFVLYRQWAEATGAVPLAPFAFAAAMVGRLPKKSAHFRLGDRARWIPCYLVGDRAAKKLRAQAADHPPSAEDRALFTFRALREARHPSRKES